MEEKAPRPEITTAHELIDRLSSLMQMKIRLYEHGMGGLGKDIRDACIQELQAVATLLESYRPEADRIDS